MRVLTKINGSCQVDEILAMDVLEDGKTTLYTAEHLLDIEISGVGMWDHENIARELLEKGFADLSHFSARLVGDDEE